MIKRHPWISIFTFYLVLLGGGWLAGQWLPQAIDLNITATSEPLIHRAIMTTMVIFILASALPFVPGAEIGFGFIMLFGGKIAPLVYVGMVTALILAFLIGRLVPLSLVGAVFEKLNFRRAHEFVIKLSRLNAQDRLALLTENAPSRIGPLMLRHRYLLLVAVINLPGNSLVGGGGGIAFIAGLSGVFSYAGYLAAIIIAVSPVPMFFYLTQ